MREKFEVPPSSSPSPPSPSSSLPPPTLGAAGQQRRDKVDAKPSLKVSELHGMFLLLLGLCLDADGSCWVWRHRDGVAVDQARARCSSVPLLPNDRCYASQLLLAMY